MTIPELIRMLETKLVTLSQQRTSAERLGDVAQVAAVDAEAETTQTTLNQLRTL